MASFFGVPRASVTWTGSPQTYQSSPEVTRGFCGRCGSQMYYQADFWPDEIHLFAVTLDDPTQFTPQAHYHYAERLPYMAISDDLPKHAASGDEA